MSNNALLGGQGNEFNFDGHLVRVFDQDDDFVISAVDVARAIGYRNPKVRAAEVIRRHPTDFEGLIRVRNLRTQTGHGGGGQCLTEDGVYIFCMVSRTPKAVEFRRAVASHLKAIRQLRLEGQFASSLLQAVMPTLKVMIDQTLAGTVANTLQAYDERQTALAREVAHFKGRLGSLERKTASLQKRPIQIIYPTEEGEEVIAAPLSTLRECRKLMGWTQAETAIYLNISRSYYSQIEEGHIEPPSALLKRMGALFRAR